MKGGKAMKKFISLILAMTLCVSLCTNAYALGKVATPVGGEYKIVYDDTDMHEGMATILISPDNGYEVDSVLVQREVLNKQNGVYRAELYPDSEIMVLYRPVGTAQPVTVTDISKSDWYYDYVKLCIRNGFFTGVSETKFDPSATLTRAMFVTVLYRMTGENKTGNTLSPDVPDNTWYTDAVRWAIAKGITKPGSDGLFYPSKAITREEMAVMIYRAAGCVGGIYDYGQLNNVSSWAKTAVGLLSFIGIISSERPQDNVTRAEAATVFARCMTLGEFWTNQYGIQLT